MMKNIKKHIVYLALALCAGATTSCVEDENYNLDNIDESISIKYEMAIPLVRSTFSIEDAINEYHEDIDIKANEDGLLYFEYQTNIEFNDLPEFEVATNDYFSFKQSDPDIDNPILLSPTPYEVSRTNKIVLTTGTGNIDKVYISKGSFGIKMQSGIITSNNIIEAFSISIENMTKDGNQLTATFDPNVSDTATIDVSGYTLSVDQNNGEESIPVKVTYKLSSSTNTSTTLDQEAWLKIDFSDNLALNMISAELNQPVLVKERLAVEISIFDDDYFSDNEIEFFDPKIFLHVDNYFGVPISVEFNNAQFANTADNETAPMSLNVIKMLNPAKITGIDDGKDFSIEPTRDTIILDKQNTPELPIILKGIYSHLYIDANVSLDPSYSEPVLFNPDSGSVELNLVTHLPFWVKLEKVSYEEEVEFDMASVYDDAGEDSTNIENIKDAYLEIFLSNDYPFEAELQCYLLDANNVVVDSVFSDGPSKLASADGRNNKDDKVKSVESTIKIDITGDKARKWRHVKAAKISFGASTAGDTFQKFFAGDKMSVSLGLNIRKAYFEQDEL